ncbi:MAG: hypothetical protein A2Y77_12195 [Planctomycetes bacterium RBG_13_62_9]|nr:MAG: hypothetical protein A2Y77_12195 [Planctomycetes bacterium RBG_13_62_9]
MESVKVFIEYTSTALEVAGVGVIVVSALMVSVIVVSFLKRGAPEKEIYQACRGRLGRGILLGLEFLVAADIISTVAVQPTFANVGVLAAIIAIRTLLSLTLEVEMTGRWPWRRGAEE